MQTIIHNLPFCSFNSIVSPFFFTVSFQNVYFVFQTLSVYFADNRTETKISSFFFCNASSNFFSATKILCKVKFLPFFCVHYNVELKHELVQEQNDISFSIDKWKVIMSESERPLMCLLECLDRILVIVLLSWLIDVYTLLFTEQLINSS